MKTTLIATVLLLAASNAFAIGSGGAGCTNITITQSDLLIPAANVQDGNLGASVVCSSAAAGAITAEQVLDGTLVNADVNSSAAIAISKLATSGSLGANVIASSVATGAVGTIQIAVDTILAADIATGAVGAAEILDGTIADADVAAGTFGKVIVLSSNVAAGNLGGTVIVSSIVANNVTNEQVAAGSFPKITSVGTLGSLAVTNASTGTIATFSGQGDDEGGTGILIKSSSTEVMQYIYFSSSTTGEAWSGITALHESGKIVFGGATEALTIDLANGRVGILNNAPSVTLNVDGDLTSTGTVTAVVFSGSGASLTALPAAAVAAGQLLPTVHNTHKNKTEIAAITPAAGDLYQCSDCTVPYTTCVATGTTVGAFSLQGAAKADCQ